MARSNKKIDIQQSTGMHQSTDNFVAAGFETSLVFYHSLLAYWMQQPRLLPWLEVLN